MYKFFINFSAKLRQAERDGAGVAGVGEVSAQRQQGLVEEHVVILVLGSHRERRTSGPAHSGL